MTQAKFLTYQTVLQTKGFNFTGRLTADMTPPNWQRRIHKGGIERVWLASDGSFKAYNTDGLVLCHGASASELSACI